MCTVTRSVYACGHEASSKKTSCGQGRNCAGVGSKPATKVAGKCGFCRASEAQDKIHKGDKNGRGGRPPAPLMGKKGVSKPY